MDFVFVGSHPAIDFLNTAYSPQGVVVECIGDGRAFAQWLEGAGLIDDGEAARLVHRFGTAALDGVAVEARRIRKWLDGWIARWRDAPGDDYDVELRRLNALLQRGTRVRRLVATQDGLRIADRQAIDAADDLIALVAEQAALLFAGEDPALVKHCAGTACTLQFVDRTKAHRRLFCSATACGNRAKVAAFRERRRTG